MRRALVHARTAVVVLSDGYDTGDPRALSEALAQLRRRARRIVWLNPLCDRPGYAPSARACRRRCRTWTCWRRGADLASIAAVLPRLLEALR